MKNLKLIFGLGAISLASNLMSCEQDQINSANFANSENSITVDPVEIKLKLVDLPAPIKTQLESLYAGFVFLEAKKTTNTAGVNVYNVRFLLKFVHYEIKFDAEGKILESKKAGIPESVLKETDLLNDITTYLKANYAGYKFVSAKKYESNGKTYFEIKIKNSTGAIVELKFDGTGKIILTSSNGQVVTIIKESELLPNIVTYLKTKYATYSLVSATKIAKNGAIYYEIKVKVGTKTYEIKFNANGVIVESSDQNVKSTAITPNTIPAGVLEYLKANYAGYVFVSGEKNEKATGTIIIIKIKQNNVTYELKFDEKGVFQSVSGSNKTSEVKINLADLPANAGIYLKNTFTQMVFISAKKVTKNEAITFVVKIKSGQKEYTVIFDSTGKMLSNKRS